MIISLEVCYVHNLKQEISLLILKEHVFVHLSASFRGARKKAAFFQMSKIHISEAAVMASSGIPALKKLSQKTGLV